MMLMRVLRYLISIIFLIAAYLKFSSQPKMVHEFAEIGLGQWFRFFTAGFEGIAAVMLLTNRWPAIAVTMLLATCAGALVVQIGPLHGDVVHVLVLVGLIFLYAYLNR